MSTEFLNEYNKYRRIYKQISHVCPKYTIKHELCNLQNVFLTIDKVQKKYPELTKNEVLLFYNNLPDGRHLLKPFPFIALEIQDYIAIKCTHLFTINSDFIELQIYHSSDMLDKSIIETFLNIIMFIKKMYNVENKSKKLLIEYYTCPFEKRLNSEDQDWSKIRDLIKSIYISTRIEFKYIYDYSRPQISINNINSGCTTIKKILIWRTEEFDKVLIHELIHFYKLENDWTITGTTGYVDTSVRYQISNNNPSVEKELRTELQTWIAFQIYKRDYSEKSVLTEICWSLMNCTKIFCAYDYIINTNTALDYYYIHKAMMLYLFMTYKPSNLWHIMFPSNDIKHITISQKDFNNFIDLVSKIEILDHSSIRMMS